MMEFIVENTEWCGLHMFNEGRLPVLSRSKGLGEGYCAGRISFPRFES